MEVSLGVSSGVVPWGSVEESGASLVPPKGFIGVGVVEGPEYVGAKDHQCQFEERRHFTRPQHTYCWRVSDDLK